MNSPRNILVRISYDRSERTCVFVYFFNLRDRKTDTCLYHKSSNKLPAVLSVGLGKLWFRKWFLQAVEYPLISTLYETIKENSFHILLHSHFFWNRTSFLWRNVWGWANFPKETSVKIHKPKKKYEIFVIQIFSYTSHHPSFLLASTEWNTVIQHSHCCDYCRVLNFG